MSSLISQSLAWHFTLSGTAWKCIYPCVKIPQTSSSLLVCLFFNTHAQSFPVSPSTMPLRQVVSCYRQPQDSCFSQLSVLPATPLPVLIRVCREGVFPRWGDGALLCWTAQQNNGIKYDGADASTHHRHWYLILQGCIDVLIMMKFHTNVCLDEMMKWWHLHSSGTECKIYLSIFHIW